MSVLLRVIRSSSSPFWGALLLLSGAASCAPVPSVLHAETGKTGVMPEPPVLPGEFLPVTAEDPTWGDPLAPVTVVEFADLACHYCAKAERVVAKVQEHYGPSKIRLVWKHNPLSFHRFAREAGEIGAAVFDLAGEDAFVAYEKSVFEGFEGREKDFVTIASEGLSAAHLGGQAGEKVLARARVEGASKVDRDLDLADEVSISGTPTFFINGVRIVGAAKESEIRAVIDVELEAAEDQLKSGTPRTSIYADRLAENVRLGKADDASDRRSPKDPTVYFVPIEGSPVRGPDSAPVTIVQFVDFEDAPSRRFAAKVEATRLAHGDDVRVVIKQNPAPEHRRADPASQLALAAYALGGERAFWATEDALVAKNGALSSADLAEVAKDVASRTGVDPARLLAAISAREARTAIARDQDLADDLEVDGLGAVFVNGKHFLGGASRRELGKLVDAELASAKTMIAAGARPTEVYTMRMADGERAPPIGAPRGTGPKIPPRAPSRGPATAKVSIQVFSDFQCPYCRRLEPTLDALQVEFPDQVRIVWRNFPLSGHPDALPAALASHEAMKERGEAGFWAFHDAIFADDGGTDRDSLLAIGKKQGLDLGALESAVGSDQLPPDLAFDQAEAERLKLHSTPSVFVGDYFVSGAKSLARFRKLVKKTLENP